MNKCCSIGHFYQQPILFLKGFVMKTTIFFLFFLFRLRQCFDVNFSKVALLPSQQTHINECEDEMSRSDNCVIIWLMFEKYHIEEEIR